MPTELYLIRHGESFANVEPVIGGMHGDAGLTERGHAQAALLEERLRSEALHVDHLYASTLPRAQQTASYVARALGMEPEPDDELQELRVGEADGMSTDEWQARFPGLRGGLSVNPYQPFATGGESWGGFLTRAGAALHGLVTRHRDQTVVAVTHGGVLEASFYLAFGLGPTGNHAGFAPLNTSITRWRHDAGSRQPWTLVSFNDAGHLAGEQPAESPEEAVQTPPDQD